jgi:SSS family solute:Na+ symporter
MNLTTLDWCIVVGFLAVIVGGAWSTRERTRSVTAFLAADRRAGRYLITVAAGMAATGVISLVALFEQNYKVGFTPAWWGLMQGPAALVMALSGWVIYRYRQTRALTLAEFFEMRYSRRFRIFAGMVAYLAGIINFAIFPSVGARFFIAFCGLSESVSVLGFEIATYPLVMAGLLAVSLALLFLGGQVAVMVTDFIQGSYCNVIFILLTVFLLFKLGWAPIGDTLLTAPEGESMVDPFDLGREKHFDVFFYVISVVIMFYCAMGWQGTQGYNCSARNAHEAKMAGILNCWRMLVLALFALIVPLCVRTFLHHPDFAAEAAAVHNQLAAVSGETEEVRQTLQNQVRTPLGLSALLPSGLIGLAVAAMLGAFISTHDTYLHSWGTILVQDVILPFRRRPLSPVAHLRLLRLSILGVAVFIFVASLVFRHTQYIVMFFALSATVFVGGAGAVIIGGLYWSRGTKSAAWTAMIAGMAAALCGIAMKQVPAEPLSDLSADATWGFVGDALLYLKTDLTGQEWSFWGIVIAVAAYVLVSLLGPRQRHDMDKLLHRGPYALPGETTTSIRDARTLLEVLGFSRDFTGRDRLIAWLTVTWSLTWTGLFLVTTAWRLLVTPIATESWLGFWRAWIWLYIAIGIVVTIWFVIGGARDLRALYRTLRVSRLADDD